MKKEVDLILPGCYLSRYCSSTFKQHAVDVSCIAFSRYNDRMVVTLCAEEDILEYMLIKIGACRDDRRRNSWKIYERD